MIKCDQCKQKLETVLFKGKNLCINCLKDASFKQDSDIARANAIFTNDELNDKLSKLINYHGDKYTMLMVVNYLSMLITDVIEKKATGIIPEGIFGKIADVEIILKELKIVLDISDYDLLLEEQNKIKNELNLIGA